jgi:hypothetical protein
VAMPPAVITKRRYSEARTRWNSVFHQCAPDSSATASR